MYFVLCDAYMISNKHAYEYMRGGGWSFLVESKQLSEEIKLQRGIYCCTAVCTAVFCTSMNTRIRVSGTNLFRNMEVSHVLLRR